MTVSQPIDAQPGLRYLGPGDPLPGGPGPGGAGGHDLAVDAGGRPRPGWGRILEAIAAIGPGELERRQRAADRQMLAQGAGVLLHDGAEDALRPWRLDVIPLVIAQEAWAPIAAGLAQRAEVLSAVVADLYGERTLLRSGVVPVEALAAHATSLRTAWDGARPPRLHVVGADLIVDGDGRVRVLRDLTDVPTGDGHALLARSIVGRALPRNRRALSVATHRPYTAALRAALVAAAPPGRRSPRTVVLTGAPDEPGHVEHAYLATRLGYDVAEAADIVVRRGRVWLRSLEGLEQVDVLLRRLPQRELDPVEDDLVGDEGVAGVVGAEREQGVHLANPYGAAVGESPALLPFLDAASRSLTGRPLALDAVEALWCGDPDQRARFAAAPEDFAVHDLGAPLAPAVALRGLTDAGVAAWLDRVAERPELYVARPGVTVATAPSLVGGRLRPAPVAVRTQVLLAPGSPVVFPGGHGRVLEAGSAGPLADRAEGVGKDVWVLGPVSRPRVAGSAEVPQVDLRRSLPTRTAEALYWTGRHAERAEAAARMVLAAGIHGVDAGARDVAGLARALRAASGGVPLGPPGPPYDLDAEVRDALAGRLSSVASSLRATTAAARGARQLLSGGTWRLLPMLDEQAAVLDELSKEPSLAAFATHRGARRRAGAPGRPGRPHQRERGPRARVAVPRHGPPARTGDARAGADGGHARGAVRRRRRRPGRPRRADRARGGRRRRRSAARTPARGRGRPRRLREPGRLPAALPQRRDGGGGRRPVAGGRRQPPVGPVPARPAHGRPPLPARPAGAAGAAGRRPGREPGARPAPPAGHRRGRRLRRGRRPR